MAKAKKNESNTEAEVSVLDPKVDEIVIDEVVEKVETPVEPEPEVVVEPEAEVAKAKPAKVEVEQTYCEKNCSIKFNSAPCGSCIVYKRLKK